MNTTLLKNPVNAGRLLAIRKKIYAKISDVTAEIITSNEPIPFSELNMADFRPIASGTQWGRKLACAWLRLTGSVPEGLRHPVLLLQNSGEGLVYSKDGTILQSITDVWMPSESPHSAGKARVIRISSEGSFELYVDCGYNGLMMLDIVPAIFGGAWVADCNKSLFDYYYDFLTLMYLSLETKNKKLKADINKSLTSSFAAFEKGEVLSARRILAKHLQKPSDSNLTFSAVGHGHLDLAWMWPLRETHRKAARTYKNALTNIQKYPDYIYATSQPQQLSWMKSQQPELYADVKQAMIDGRIEMQGGFWTECDTNMPCGESLIRQAVYGVRFYKEELGTEPKLCWLPDAFGFSGNLPQILMGCGMDYFSTIKLAWNKTNVFPKRSFYWVGIDGSRVLVHMPPEGDYNSHATPKNLLKAEKQYPEKDLGTALLVFGAGDGGGGPQETHLELLKRQRDMYGLPKVEMSTSLDFFKHLETLGVSDVHCGELYLETHQGTYTTQAKNKYYNRLCERLLHNAEVISVQRLLGGTPYPHDFFAELWREVLLYQFHDIIPGTSITRVNTEAVVGYKVIEKKLRAIQGEGAQGLYANYTSFARAEYVLHNNHWYHVSLAPYSAAHFHPIAPLKDTLSFTKDSISNGLLTLRFNADGEVCSCTDTDGFEHCGGLLNRLTLYSDRFEIPFNAWDIDKNYYKKPHKTLSAKSSSTSIDGARVIRTTVYTIGRSTVKQSVILEIGSDTVKFDTMVDWHETLKMLRAEFSPAAYGETVKCEIQMGHIERTTTERDSVEKAQFEVCAHKWVAVSEGDHGFALLNNCKYGHRIKNGVISLNLLRSPIFPDKQADKGTHHFKYAFCPFKGDDDLQKVIAEGYRLNNPLVPTAEAFDRIAYTTNPSIVLETIKEAEDGSGVILRLYESLGKTAVTDVVTTLPYDTAYITDLLENCQMPAELTGLSFTGFEIKTILLKRR